VEGPSLIVDARLNINLTAMTIELVTGKKKKMIANMCANLLVDLEPDLRRLFTSSEG